MDECQHYSIRRDVAKHREREPRMNYPFTLPQGLTEQQIRSLLPLMASRKCKRWNCHQCVKEFMEHNCPHDQLPIKASRPSVTAPNLDFLLVTKTNKRSAVENIDALEVLICTEDSENAEVECITKKQQPDQHKVFFDLNIPIVDPCDEALENHNNPAPAAEELDVAYNPESSNAELVSKDEQQAKSLEASEPEASAEVANDGISNSNVSPLPEILILGANKRPSFKKARKYRSISYSNLEGNTEGSRNVPTSDPQSNKSELKNKKKMQQCGRVEERPASNKVSEATKDGSKQNRQNRTVDCNQLPLKQKHTLANVSPSPRRESGGKRKHSVMNHDQNGNSDATLSKSSEKGLQNESRTVDLQLKKRRIFCTVTKTPLANADQSQRVELVVHKSRNNAPSSSKRMESFMTPLADHGSSLPTRIEKANSKEAYQLVLERKRKIKNGGEQSGAALDKELVLQDKPISTIAKDVPMLCLEDDNLNLKQFMSEMKTRMLSQGFGVKTPSADNNRNVTTTSQNGTNSPTQSEKSSLKGVKRRGRPKRVPMKGASSSGTRRKQGNEQPATLGKELVVRDTPALPCEAALQLLSMVAVDTWEKEALSDCGLDGTVLPIMEEFHVPPSRNVLEMGYEGCIEVTNPADYFLVDGEGDRFKLGPEDLPLRPHRFLPAKM